MRCVAILRIPSVSPDRDASSKAIRNLISISSAVSDDVLTFETQFEDTDATTQHIPRKTAANPLLSALYLLLYQIRVTAVLYQNREKLDAVFLHAGGFLFVLPIVYCKLDGIATAVSVIGEPHKGYENVSSGSLTDRFATLTVLYAEKFAYAMADGLAVFSDDMLTYSPISNYRSKCKRVRFNYESVPDDVPAVTDRSTSIVYLGRICELKGSDRVFQVAENLAADTDRDVKTVFVGDGNLLEPLRQRREEKELDNIEFLGWVGEKTVDEMLRDSKILLLPSRSEGLPKALLEAMARGTVPVVTPIGDMPAVVDDGVDGVILDDAHPDRIAETVVELLESDRFPEMSEHARQTIRQEYSYATAKSEFDDFLEECTA